MYHGESIMKKKIFVGNLSWKVTEEILKPLFEAFGAVVSVKIIVDQYTGKSKGFGFVEMENDDDATRAIDELNEQPLLERNMRVSLAQPRNDRPAGSGMRGEGRSERSGGEYRGGNSGGGERSFRPRTAERNFNSY
jgi:RNA recognition motif-containing protein